MVSDENPHDHLQSINILLALSEFVRAMIHNNLAAKPRRSCAEQQLRRVSHSLDRFYISRLVAKTTQETTGAVMSATSNVGGRIKGIRGNLTSDGLFTIPTVACAYQASVCKLRSSIAAYGNAGGIHFTRPGQNSRGQQGHAQNRQTEDVLQICFHVVLLLLIKLLALSC